MAGHQVTAGFPVTYSVWTLGMRTRNAEFGEMSPSVYCGRNRPIGATSPRDLTSE